MLRTLQASSLACSRVVRPLASVSLRFSSSLTAEDLDPSHNVLQYDSEDSVAHLPLWQVAEKIKKKELGAEDVVAACMARMHATSRLGAFAYEGGEDTQEAQQLHALARARAIDGALADGRDVGALAGIPVAVKANYSSTSPCMAPSSPTNAGSNLLKGHYSSYSATVLERLHQQDSVLVGKTAMDEFAMGSTTTHSALAGPCINPHSSPTTGLLSAGGSSGGSAVAVATGACFGALGSDTGGSVRQPAAWCGVVGLKPSYGRLSRHGLVAFASSLDCPSIFIRHAKDAALLLDVMSGEDVRDGTSMRGGASQVFSSISSAEGELNLTDHVAAKKGAKLRVGIPQEYWVEELSEEMEGKWRETARMLEEAGAEVVPCSLPHTRHALPTYLIIATAEASSNLSRYDGVRYGQRVEEEGMGIEELMTATRDKGFGEEVKRRILLGTFALSKEYGGGRSYSEFFVKAQQLRTLIKQDFDNCFAKEGIDVLLTPTAPGPACSLVSSEGEDPVQEYLHDVMTTPASLAGVCAVSMPMPVTRGELPVGMQLIAGRGEEDVLLQTAHVMERRWQS